MDAKIQAAKMGQSDITILMTMQVQSKLKQKSMDAEKS
jgi:hypothetical protein